MPKLKFNVKYAVVLMSEHGKTELKRFEFDDVHEAINKHVDEDRIPVEQKGSYWDIIVEYKM